MELLKKMNQAEGTLVYEKSCVSTGEGEAVMILKDGFQFLAAVADFCGDGHGFFQGREGEPLPVLCPEGRGEEGFIWAHSNGVGLHILAADINRRAYGQSQTLALASGIADSAFVPAYNITVHIQIVSLRIGFSGVA